MAKQLLQRAQIRSPRQQMRRETVAQRVRGQAVGQVQPVPRSPHRAPHQIWIERSTTHPDEQRRGPDQRPWALPGINRNRLAHRLDHRHHASLAALARHAQRPPDRQHVGGQRHRLGHPQSRSVEQQQDRHVAFAHPVARRRAGLLGQRHDIFRARRTRQGARALGGAGARQLRDIAGIFGGKGQERAHRRHFARRAARPQTPTIAPAAAPLGQERT